MHEFASGFSHRAINMKYAYYKAKLLDNLSSLLIAYHSYLKYACYTVCASLAARFFVESLVDSLIHELGATEIAERAFLQRCRKN